MLQIKAQGDAAAGAQDWDTAKQCYQQVLAALDNGVAADAGVSAREEELPVFFEAKIHSNLALVHLKATRTGPSSAVGSNGNRAGAGMGKRLCALGHGARGIGATH